MIKSNTGTKENVRGAISMKKFIIGIVGVCIIGIAGTSLYMLNRGTGSNIPQATSEAGFKIINKILTGYIFSGEGKLVKEVPVKINGKQYSETSSVRDYFTGTIEINGETVQISSTKDKNAAVSDLDTQKFYLASNPVPNNIKGEVQLTTSIIISKDFSTVYGYTPNVRKNFGKGAFFKSDKGLKTPQDKYIEYTEEAAKRVSLYIEVMKAAFKQENGGNGFIAVKEDTLEGLKEEKSKQDVLEGLKALSSNVYWYEGVKDDKSLFKFDTDGRMLRTLNGTLLSLKVEEFKGDEAVVEATSWFGNLGAVCPKYKAVYKDRKWKLEVLSMAIS